MAEKTSAPGSKPPLLTLLSDHPITASGDDSTDMLGLHERLCAPLDILRHPATRTPFTIALYGDWGTGKTSAMRWLESQLLLWNDSPARDSATQPHLTPVWFYPWKYHSREDVWRGIIAEVILATLKTGSADTEDFSKRAVHVAKRYGKFLGASFLHVLANTKVKSEAKASGGVPGVAGVGTSTSIELNGQAVQDIYDEYKKASQPHAPFLNEFESQLTDWVRDTFDDKTRRLVLLIDDLDRCLPDVALEVLEALKLYLNIPGLLFVAGLDRSVIDQIVTEHYKKSGVEGRIALRYLDKLFQVEIDVAPSQLKVSAFLDQKISQLDTATGKLWSQSLDYNFEDGSDYRKIIEKSIRRLGRHNPRDFTRILNSLLIVSHAALTSTPTEEDPVDQEEEKALRFAQGAQVYLLRRLLHDYTAKAENLLRTEAGQSWLSRLSKFRHVNPDYIPQKGETDMSPTMGALEQLRAKEAVDVVKNEIAHLIEETKTLEDATGAFDAIYQYGWDLLLIPFSPSVAASMPQEKKEAATAFRLSGGPMPDEILAATARSLDIPISEVSSQRFRNVSDLDLGGTSIDDLTALRGLTSLQSLDLSDTQVSDLSPLEKLVSLQVLNLQSTQVSDINALKYLTGLRVLSLAHTQVNDLTPLYALKDCLKFLWLQATPAYGNKTTMAALRDAMPNTNIQ